MVVVWSPNGTVFECHLNTGQVIVCYLDVCYSDPNCKSNKQWYHCRGCQMKESLGINMNGLGQDYGNANYEDSAIGLAGAAILKIWDSVYLCYLHFCNS